MVLGVVASEGAKPVVDDVVSEVENEALRVDGFIGVVSGVWASGLVVGVEVVMERVAVAPSTFGESGVTVFALGVDRFVEAFRDDAPLDCDVGWRGLFGLAGVVCDGERFIDAPACGTVVDDDVSAMAGDTQSIEGLIFTRVAEAKAHMADDDFVSSGNEGVIFEADASAGGGLSRDGDVRISYLQG